MIEPGTLIVGVSEEGILHQLQLCRSEGGTELWLGAWWDPGCPNIPLSPWSTFSPQFPYMLALYSGCIYIFPTRHLSSLLSGAKTYATPEPGMK